MQKIMILLELEFCKKIFPKFDCKVNFEKLNSPLWIVCGSKLITDLQQTKIFQKKF